MGALDNVRRALRVTRLMAPRAGAKNNKIQYVRHAFNARKFPAMVSNTPLVCHTGGHCVIIAGTEC